MNKPNAAAGCKAVIVIVDFFKGERVVKNVQELLSQDSGEDVEIYVVDNSCDRQNREVLSQLSRHPRVHLKFNDKNEGYVRACNDAASRVDARYIVLTNPDISWRSTSTLSELMRLMDSNPDIGIAAPRQVNDDDTTPETVRRFPNLLAQIARRTGLRGIPFFRRLVERYELKNFDYSKSQYVDWIQSSLMIVRSECWKKVGGLDASYFIFMADPELCFQAWDSGYKVFYTAESLVGADGKRASAGGLGQIFKSRALRYHIRDALIYQFKHLLRPMPRNRNN